MKKKRASDGRSVPPAAGRRLFRSQGFGFLSAEMEESMAEEMSNQMGHEEPSQSGRGKNKKHWTVEEDKALVESLLELVDAGTHRGDNGFKPGYLRILEEKMFSRGHTAIKGTPHIASRLKVLKQDYGMYNEMMTSNNLSGFGYNSQTGCLEADP